MDDDYDDLPVGHIETMAEDYVLLDTTEGTAPNGKPAGIDPPKHEPMPANWEVRSTPEGKIYYVNHTTRTTHWTCPKNFTDVSSKDTKGGPLPEGWEQLLDQNGRPYYADHNTRTTSWVRPNPSNEDTFRQLPRGWERRLTEDGKARLYFFFTTIAAAAVLLLLAIAAPAPVDSIGVSFDKVNFNETVTYDDLPESIDDENELENRRDVKSNIEIRTFKGAHCQTSAVFPAVGFNANYP
ncbi:MAG: hypothetical protein LQ343_004451 [Gyalolechia ehrenbergii]|nr:MAG: hypothetical protein LQ343_004451 [Gyalolechia ehrenbergii]